jgi:hypothetical protein
LTLLGLNVSPARGQATSQGTVTVTVLDPDGRAVPGADLTLQDLSTNDTRTGTTQDHGNYSFVSLALGTYKLTVSKTAFQSQVFDSVIVHAAQVTDITVDLKIGETTQRVEVYESETPLMTTTSNAISTTIDMKQIEDLPLYGRDISQLAYLVAGFNGTWNGLPVIAQTNNIDGVISSTSRMKFAGNTTPAVSVRIENIQEMTVETDQMNANEGFGQAPMEVNFITRSGTNSFHGRAFEDFQNSYLNANSWYNDAAGIPKGHQELNDFGGSLGGPIIRNKLFFFADFSEYISPNTTTMSQEVLDAAAQKGVFTYVGTNGNQTVCLFTATCPNGGTGIVDAYNTANGTNLPTWPTASAQLNSDMAVVNAAVLKGVSVTQNPSEPSIPFVNWTVPGSLKTYFPAIRVDYNMSQKLRVNFAWNMTKVPPTPYGYGYLPGFPTADYWTKNYTTALGLDWTISPTLINSFRGGFLYNATIYANSSNFKPGGDPAAAGGTAPQVYWGFSNPQGINISPQQYYLSSGNYYPLFNFSDTVTWQHGAHTFSYGLSWWREQDHYYNPPAGVQYQWLGINSDDPASSIFQLSNPAIPNATNGNITDLGNLYATLEGRVAGSSTFEGYTINPATNQYYTTVKSYSLDELIGAWGLFAQDSYRVRPNLTVNYSLRWDFTSDDHDLTNIYHGASSANDLFGPSGPNGLFNPGTLDGNPLGGAFVARGHQYKPWHIAPQPQVGLAWVPHFTDGLLGKLTGGGSNTVIRAGFGLRYFTEPQQYFWDAATNYGFAYFQGDGLYGCTACYGSGGPTSVGYFPSGSWTLQPNYAIPSPYQLGYVPAKYEKSYTQESVNRFAPGAPGLNGLNPNIAQPYVQEWNLGVQRQLGRNNAIEISYHGNRSVHQWINLDTNEVNIFGNYGGTTFLNQFEQAQTNLKLNNTLGTKNPYYGTFAYNPAVAGEAPTPVFAAAFQGPFEGAPIAADYGFGTFITYLQQGQAGAMANALAQPSGGQGGANFFCNLVGQSFYPCGTTLGYVGAGAGYPINYFQADPYYTGEGSGYMTSGGYSTYNALQVDFRQKQWHGMKFDVNYTWSKSLGMAGLNYNWTASVSELTLRNQSLAYQPTNFDYHHVIHANGTYDLPFGKGKQFLNRSGLLDRAVGGWTLGTIFYYQTGAPFSLYGGYLTYNDYADGGVVLNGISRSQLQSMIGVYRINLQTYQTANNCTNCAPTYVSDLPPSIITGPTLQGGLANQGTNRALAYANMSAGTLIPPIFLYGPHSWNDDIAVTKAVPIRENIRFTLQGEFLNVFNHPNFGNPNSAVNYGGFGLAGGPSGEFGRAIELRLNLSF